MKLSTLYEDPRQETQVSKPKPKISYGWDSSSSNPWLKQIEDENFHKTDESEKNRSRNTISKNLTAFPYDEHGRHIVDPQTQLYQIIRNGDISFLDAYEKASSYSKRINVHHSKTDYRRALNELIKKGIVGKIGTLYTLD